jgi:hypothetical protein
MRSIGQREHLRVERIEPTLEDAFIRLMDVSANGDAATARAATRDPRR